MTTEPKHTDYILLEVDPHVACEIAQKLGPARRRIKCPPDHDGIEMAKRIVACVNACAGLPDPAALLADNERLREALRKAYTELNIIRARDGVPYCHDGIKSDVCPEYFSSVVEECRIALSATERKE